LRYRIGELRAFNRFPRRLRITDAGPRGLRVLLYGIPYADWNATLCDPELWRGLRVVSEVRRVPGWHLLLPRRAGTILIPMKTEHHLGAPRRYPGLLADREAIGMLADKSRFPVWMAAHGFASDMPAVYADGDSATFPCVVKRHAFSASVGVEIATSRAHLDAILQSRWFRGKPAVLQALVPGTVEYATFLLCDRGRILWDATFASTMAGPAVIKNDDNPGERRVVATPPQALERFAGILGALRYSGPCAIDYKRRDDGRPAIFEINPRLGGTLMMPAHAAMLRDALAKLIEAVTAAPGS